MFLDTSEKVEPIYFQKNQESFSIIGLTIRVYHMPDNAFYFRMAVFCFKMLTTILYQKFQI